MTRPALSFYGARLFVWFGVNTKREVTPIKSVVRGEAGSFSAMVWQMLVNYILDLIRSWQLT